MEKEEIQDNPEEEPQAVLNLPDPQSMSVEITDEKPGLGIIRVRRIEVKGYNLDNIEDKLNRLYERITENE